MIQEFRVRMKKEMGKSKRRILHKGINDKIANIKREDALKSVADAYNKKNVTPDINNLISLFGFSAEELLEFGVSYEDVLAMKGFLS